MLSLLEKTFFSYLDLSILFLKLTFLRIFLNNFCDFRFIGKPFENHEMALCNTVSSGGYSFAIKPLTASIVVSVTCAAALSLALAPFAHYRVRNDASQQLIIIKSKIIMMSERSDSRFPLNSQHSVRYVVTPKCPN